MGIYRDAMAAYKAHTADAETAYAIYAGYCNNRPPSRVPSMDTVIRLAFNISLGKSVEESAAREYCYRWHLAIKAPDQCGATGKHDWRSSADCISIFGTPHTIGM